MPVSENAPFKVRLEVPRDNRSVSELSPIFVVLNCTLSTATYEAAPPVELIVTPVAALMATAKALRDMYGLLHRHGTLREHTDRLMDFGEFQRSILEVDRHYETERRYKSDGASKK